MTSKQTLRPVTIEQLTSWIERNKQHTWSHDVRFGNNPQESTLHMKYIYFCLDTRDMKIFRIEYRGWGENKVADFRDEGEGTILDKLQKILDDRE